MRWIKTQLGAGPRQRQGTEPSRAGVRSRVALPRAQRWGPFPSLSLELLWARGLSALSRSAGDTKLGVALLGGEARQWPWAARGRGPWAARGRGPRLTAGAQQGQALGPPAGSQQPPAKQGPGDVRVERCQPGKALGCGSIATEHEPAAEQAAEEAKGILACVRNAVATGTGGDDPPVASTGEATPGTLVQPWAPPAVAAGLGLSRKGPGAQGL